MNVILDFVKGTATLVRTPAEQALLAEAAAKQSTPASGSAGIVK